MNIVATRNLGKLKEKLELQLTIACSNADNIIDLGANVGSVTKSLLKIGKPVFAFEPDPVPFEELNKIIDSNLKTYLAAAWTSDGYMELFRHHDWEKTKSHTSSSLNANKKNVDRRNTEVVKTIDVAQFVLKINGRYNRLRTIFFN